MGAIHGFATLLATVLISYAGHLAFPLLRGVRKILPQMRTLTFWSTCLSFFAITSGNWVYMRYRYPANGARAWLLENTLLVHYLFMEDHEFSVLFTLSFRCCLYLGFVEIWRLNFRAKKSSCSYRNFLALMAMMFFDIGGLVSGLNVASMHSL
ncbi:MULTISPECIES: hypothetical protein [Okeania]|nr:MULTISPECIES: hypothetical protein [Okeania]